MVSVADKTKEPVGFRITPQERNLLELIAAARGITLSALARDFVMDMAYAAAEDAGGVDELLEQARRRSREEEMAKQAKALVAERAAAEKAKSKAAGTSRSQAVATVPAVRSH